MIEGQQYGCIVGRTVGALIGCTDGNIEGSKLANWLVEVMAEETGLTMVDTRDSK